MREPKILITNKISDAGKKRFEELGFLNGLVRKQPGRGCEKGHPRL